MNKMNKTLCSWEQVIQRSDLMGQVKESIPSPVMILQLKLDCYVVFCLA